MDPSDEGVGRCRMLLLSGQAGRATRGGQSSSAIVAFAKVCKSLLLLPYCSSPGTAAPRLGPSPEYTQRSPSPPIQHPPCTRMTQSLCQRPAAAGLKDSRRLENSRAFPAPPDIGTVFIVYLPHSRAKFAMGSSMHVHTKLRGCRDFSFLVPESNFLHHEESSRRKRQ